MRKLKAMFPAHSLVWRLFGVISGCIVAFLILLLLLNTFALQPYYRHQKQQSLVHIFQEVYAVCRDSEQLQEKLEYLQFNDTVSVVIWADRQILYSTQNQQRYFLPSNLRLENGTFVFDAVADEPSHPAITLYGKLYYNTYVLVRTPLAAIEESTAISNRFLVICGGVILLFALVAALLLARSFTVPIRRLSQVAENVAKLNFSDRFADDGQDELAALGRSIHTMSRALERTITELKNANAQLMQDIQIKTKQNEAHRAFISNVSHELKTPIALISTYAESLSEGITDTESRLEYCSVITDEAQKMGDMLRRMTMLMQIESGNEELSLERFDVSELLGNVMRRLAPQFADTAAHVALPPAGPVYVWADSFLIEDVLVNYITNAFHHVPPQGTVSGDVRITAENTVEITVRNTGAPIPTDDLPHIWESFYKVDKARTRAYGGSGIGLSVVAAIMNAHRMPYGVRNRVAPDGTTAVEFYIILPQT